MKIIRHTKSTTLLLIALLIGLASCSKEEMPFIEPPKSIEGNWKIVKATRNGVDLTQRISFNEFRLVFDKGNTYRLNNLLPFIVSKNGNWAFDDPAYPFAISFTPEGSETATKVKTFSFPIVNGSRQLIISFSPGCDSNVYEYTLEPTTE